ncbi:MAG: hypothetical protein K8R16_11035, partial [Anaerolineales bacterium]|nr:hypothetical protein [Anaerolineales bacterium]
IFPNPAAGYCQSGQLQIFETSRFFPPRLMFSISTPSSRQNQFLPGVCFITFTERSFDIGFTLANILYCSKYWVVRGNFSTLPTT